jgi:LPXTG-motif cell wall-anchored protein
MRRMTFVLILLVLALSGPSLYPQATNAQQANPPTEIVTLQTDATSPTGTHVTGTVLIKRYAGSPVTDDVTFTGMINGAPATAHVIGSESWKSANEADFTIVSILDWPAGVPKPSVPLTLDVVQTSPGLITVNGVPFAISGQLKPVGSGDANFVITNPGAGTQPISILPSTGHDLSPTALLLAAGGILMLALGLGIRSRRGWKPR